MNSWNEINLPGYLAEKMPKVDWDKIAYIHPELLKSMADSASYEFAARMVISYGSKSLLPWGINWKFIDLVHYFTLPVTASLLARATKLATFGVFKLGDFQAKDLVIVISLVAVFFIDFSVASFVNSYRLYKDAELEYREILRRADNVEKNDLTEARKQAEINTFSELQNKYFKRKTLVGIEQFFALAFALVLLSIEWMATLNYYQNFLGKGPDYTTYALAFFGIAIAIIIALTNGIYIKYPKSQAALSRKYSEKSNKYEQKSLKREILVLNEMTKFIFWTNPKPSPEECADKKNNVLCIYLHDDYIEMKERHRKEKKELERKKEPAKNDIDEKHKNDIDEKHKNELLSLMTKVKRHNCSLKDYYPQDLNPNN